MLPKLKLVFSRVFHCSCARPGTVTEVVGFKMLFIYVQVVLELQQQLGPEFLPLSSVVIKRYVP